MPIQRRTKLNALLLGTTAACAVLSTTAFAADEPSRQRFDIRSQDAAAALNEYARQAGVQIVFPYDRVRGRLTPDVQGDLTRQEALAMLTDGMGLVVTSDAAGMVTLRDATDPQSGSAAGDGADGTVDALIVTAQKREEDIQDVPIAISAFTQEALERSQVAGGPDLITQVPNMTFTKTNFSSYSIQLRGIGTQAISATVDPAVAVAFNNTSFIRNRFFEQEFYDLQRVEVLRGPQGTLYGRNATAGVVNIISQKPSFGYEAKLSADVANYNSTRLEGMINVPLVEDMVALRIAGAWTKREGYSTNELTGNQIDGRDLWSSRVSLRIEPTDAISANIIWEHFEEDDDRLRSGKQLCKRDDRTMFGDVQLPGLWFYYSNPFSQGCLPASLYSPVSFQAPDGFSLPFYHPLGQIFLPTVSGLDPYASTVQSHDLRVIESTVDPRYHAETNIVEAQLSFDLPGNLTLSSETAWLSDDIFSLQDYNRFATTEGAFDQAKWDNLQTFNNGEFWRENLLNDGVFCDPQLGCSSRLVAVDVSTARSAQFSQEFRLSSDYDGPFNFSLGANYLRYDTEDKYYVFINTLSMLAAISPNGHSRRLPRYEPGITDNHECLLNGIIVADPNLPQEVEGCVYMDTNPIGQLNDLGHNYFLSKNPYKLISYAVFGEGYYDLAENLRLTAGLRWTVDKKEAPRIPSWVLGVGSPGYGVQEVVEQEWREPTGRLTLDWKPDLSFTDDTMVYASYSHGYKAGGSNPPPTGIVYRGATAVAGEIGELINTMRQNSALSPRTFKPEFVDAFEIGTKNSLLDGALTLNLAAFYYDYQGYQISQIVNRSAINMNFDATVWGLEIEADWRPLENLRLGFKGGYEDTKVADGSRAIDVMERNYGHGPDSDDPWIVVRPFPTFANNCVIPVFVLERDGMMSTGGGNSFYNGNPGPCENAYLIGYDPATLAPYEADPDPVWGTPPGYPGWNPFDLSQGHNFGEGFFKPLGGNELPNAPHFTATITADYTVPLPADWLMTLHTDLYYQSEAWTRIFNMEGYDKLKAYTNVNLAAIFTNDAAGWKVMAYVKNVLDRDSITGSFLNSDDTGLTTNVFLTEPRLYGLRVTKEFTGGPWWTGGDPASRGPFPLTVELGGMVQRQDAPYGPLSTGAFDAFSDKLDPANAQNRDLHWGDGRSVKITYQPQGSPWRLGAAARFGKTNGADKFQASELGDTGCRVGPPLTSAAYCDPDVSYGFFIAGANNYVSGDVTQREDHMLVDFTVGREMGLGEGSGLTDSVVSIGLRYGQLNSRTRVDFVGIPDWDLPTYMVAKYDAEHSRRDVDVTASRKFQGAGPMVSWEASKALIGDDQTGRFGLDWSIGAGVLFGKQEANVQGHETIEYLSDPLKYVPYLPDEVVPNPVDVHRSKDVSVPVLDASLGLSYDAGRFKIGAGYRWERYLDAIDGGYSKREKFDRTFDGPYLKLSVGFGG